MGSRQTRFKRWSRTLFLGTMLGALAIPLLAVRWARAQSAPDGADVVPGSCVPIGDITIGVWQADPNDLTRSNDTGDRTLDWFGTPFHLGVMDVGAGDDHFVNFASYTDLPSSDANDDWSMGMLDVQASSADWAADDSGVSDFIFHGSVYAGCPGSEPIPGLDAFLDASLDGGWTAANPAWARQAFSGAVPPSPQALSNQVVR